MSDAMITVPAGHGPREFHDLVGAVLAAGWPRTTAVVPAAAGTTEWSRHPDARLVLLLEGAQVNGWPGGGRRLLPGDGLWIAPGAPLRQAWDEPCVFLGVVLRPRFIRFLIGRGPGTGRHPGMSPWAWHSPGPALGAVHGLAGVLDRLADPQAANDCLRAFLRLLPPLLAGPPVDASPGQATWRRVHEHLSGRCTAPLSRAGAARALRLNPTYLSDLCARHAGMAFRDLVQDLRLRHARRLLKERPDLPVAAIADACGFASAGYFGRVFRRAEGASPARWRVRDHS